MDTINRLRAAGYRIRTRGEWGSKELSTYAWRLRTKPVDFPVSYGFVHITVTEEHGDAGMRLLERIGKQRFGSGVSYNWVIDHKTDHTIYLGQPLAAKGTHTVNDFHLAGFPYNLNYAGHAVAYMGNVDDEVCDECIDTIAAIFAAEKLEGVLRIGDNIFPHRKFAAKSCPGDKLNARMRDISDAVKRKVDAGNLRADHKRVAARPAPVLAKPKPAKPRVSLAAAKRAAEKAPWAKQLPGTEDDVKHIRAALKAEKVGSYAAWQRKLGYKGKDADGVPGEVSLTKLGQKHGFEVVK